MRRSPLKRRSHNKKASKSALKRKADALAGAWFRASECACKGYKGHVCAGRIEWAHIKSRGILCIRHSPLNALPLCWKAHHDFTLHPDEWVKFVEHLFPGRWDTLNLRIQEAMTSGEKPDYQYWIDWYSKRSDNFNEWSRTVVREAS